MFRSLFPTLLLILLCGRSVVSGHDGGGVDEGSSDIFPYNYTIRDLDNGLRAIVNPTGYPNIVTLRVVVLVGSRDEVQEGKSGFAHFFEHMMFRGTPNYTDTEFKEIYQGIGATFNANTDSDRTLYYVNFLKDDLETAMELESDRFKHLNYTEEAFKTEAGAILGEYNYRLSPDRKIAEAQRNITFTVHPYRHTTMGFLEDIMDMPNQYEFSKVFFDRFYRPENAIVYVAGDVETESTLDLVEEYFGDWERGNYTSNIPQEPDKFPGAVYTHVKWETSKTLPVISVAFRGPPYSDTKKDMIAMDIIFSIVFSQSSPLYQKLVLQERKVNTMWADYPDTKDPYLVGVGAEVNAVEDIWYVRDEILKVFADLRVNKVSGQMLEDTKSRLRYSFANGMDSTDAIADAAQHPLHLTRTPESLNRVYRLYDTITADDVISTANTYFVDGGLVVVTLSNPEDVLPLPLNGSFTESVDGFVDSMDTEEVNITSITKPKDTPLVAFRLMFYAGAANDPPGKEGLASLTAKVIVGSGSASMSYEQIKTALKPMAASFGASVDKELTSFGGKTHVDYLNEYYRIVSEQFLNPGWEEDDFIRIRDQAINSIDDLKKEDYDLCEEVLYETFFEGHPYGSTNRGHYLSLKNITLGDVQRFYKEHYTQENLVFGLTGGYDDDWVSNFKSDIRSRLKVSGPDDGKSEIPPPTSPQSPHAVIVHKESSKSTALWIGFPINVTMSHPDYAALHVAVSYLGSSMSSPLFDAIRTQRGLSYGAYSTIRAGKRQHEILALLSLPVDTIENVHHATRLARYHLDMLVEGGISQEDFERVRNSQVNAIKISIDTQTAELDAALGALYYNIEGDYIEWFTDEMNKLTVDRVNDVVRAHVKGKVATYAFVTGDADGLSQRLANNTRSAVSYPTEKPSEVLAEDEMVQDYDLGLTSGSIDIIPLDAVFSGHLGDGAVSDEFPPESPKALGEGDSNDGSSSSLVSVWTAGVGTAIASVVSVVFAYL